MKTSQKQIVINQLRAEGSVSRNWCLQRYISRLSAIIYDLRKRGWEFTEIRRGGDYLYVWKNQYPNINSKIDPRSPNQILADDKAKKAAEAEEKNKVNVGKGQTEMF